MEGDVEVNGFGLVIIGWRMVYGVIGLTGF